MGGDALINPPSKKDLPPPPSRIGRERELEDWKGGEVQCGAKRC
jgi:hypothetical protein